jgi:Domain of unknown function (DUF4261)
MVAVLFSSTVRADEVEARIGASVERRESRHDLPIVPECSILTRQDDTAIIVDLFNHQWHDTSGKDQGANSPNYAWDQAHEQLLAPPWSLKRAVQQYRGSDDAAIAAANHSAYTLLRVPYQPAGNTLDAFERLMAVVERMLAHPQAVCYFNPSGEVLSGRARVASILERVQAQKLPPLELLVNARMFDIGAGWAMADSVGLEQFDLPDQEVLFSQEAMQSVDAIAFVKNLAMHFIQNHPEVCSGDTAGGPGESVWEAVVLGQGSLPPHRKVVRWLPENREGMPSGMEVP